MKVIFLDIDGVLNNDRTKEVVAGYTFVDEDKIVLLKEILDQTARRSCFRLLGEEGGSARST